MAISVVKLCCVGHRIRDTTLLAGVNAVLYALF